MRALLLAGALSLAPLLALATGATPNEESLLVPTLKMLGALALVIGILLLCYAASRKGMSLMPGKRNSQIHIIETRPLGGKKMLCLVQVRDQELLLGVSAERIDCLSRFPADDSDFQTTLERLVPADPAPEPEAKA